MDYYSQMNAQETATRTLANRLLSAALFLGVVGATLCMVDSSSQATQHFVAPPVQTQAARGYIPHAVKPKTKIVLNRGVEGLGKQGDVVEVAPGYYRNFLYPTGQADIATPAKLESIRKQQEAEEKAAEEAMAAARKAVTSLATIGKFVVKKEVGPDGQIFGSVSEQEVVDIIRRQMGLNVDKKDLILPEIKELGSFPAEIKLHPKVVGKFNVVVEKKK
jgi:large subunit ribosomal protein L9|eukprot:CAMPEP_0174299990 /NCGR_PEP_ID=MMETSP0809-20121228/58211_1 /TAXON_ID=73025 ORGANISM="Eutreptiella gymnastica-like, Strain CCMP1594" /NCGR_SAMPLE_ID=MMETSP0809 /ASSEMBLY_ACC=CAM_ASM_000658 /LENGTH=218 /DNA_ID=CAMNT_0015405517 /DNA_START=38 /DNA_END=694 /DNA_ORIENTATION=-